ncbi:MAG: amidohydrolase [Candidatus Eremiobacteraeota bacterium]|nr:amidohydrolase [Candidatus Eremiobacteraeota bacterium]
MKHKAIFTAEALYLMAILLIVAGAGPVAAQCDATRIISPPRPPDKVIIYPAKHILTMERCNPQATAVAVRGKRILAVGTLEEVKAALGDMPSTVDTTFQSKVLLPGLIDQHLHPLLGALTLSTEVIATEDWELPGRTFKAASGSRDYLSRLKAADGTMKDKSEWLFSWGYHALWHGKIDRSILDSISAARPIVIWQRSCHEFYLNTAAIKALGLTDEAMKGRGDASRMYNWAEGHWWETGLNLIMDPLIRVFATPQRMTFGLKQMVTYLHQNGVTAYMEPGALISPDLMRLYQSILGADDTPFYSYFVVDGRSQVDSGLGLAESLAATEKEVAWAPQGKVSFFPMQIKLFADGAIISQLMQMKEGYLDGHHGEWMMTPEHLEERARLYWDAGYQLHIHVNGDLGLETVLDILEGRMRENPRANHRTVIVHFACSTEDQVARIARLGAIVSANPYYTVGFADMYSRYGLGPKRADSMVRSASVTKHRIPLSFHSDLPMGPSAPLNFVWCAVNRETPSGRVAAPEQRIGVEDALRAVTIESAYSWQKENELGSIAPGKIANFTVLEQNPLAVEPMKLNRIPIWGTVFEGKAFPVPAGAGRPASSLKDATAGTGFSPCGNGVKCDSHDGCPCEVAVMVAKALMKR